VDVTVGKEMEQFRVKFSWREEVSYEQRCFLLESAVD